jgi:hypothetical protein
VLQAAQQQHDEEHGHHLQRVLVPPLHSKLLECECIRPMRLGPCGPCMVPI